MLVVVIKSRSIKKLLNLFPHVKNITSEAHKKKGTIVLLNERINRKYYIYNSGYAKAVDAKFNNKTDFINAWINDWQHCRPMDNKELINSLIKYIEYFDTYERNYSIMYNRKRYPTYVYSINEDKYYYDEELL